MAIYWPHSFLRVYGPQLHLELCQYPAILTSHLVNNPHIFSFLIQVSQKQIFELECFILHFCCCTTEHWQNCMATKHCRFLHEHVHTWLLEMLKLCRYPEGGKVFEV